MNDLAIQTIGLTRYFDSLAVVRDLDLAIPRGSISGLLGLNGAGKTTTLRMILGLLAPTRGESFVLGIPSQKLTALDRGRIGHTVEGHFLYGWMKVSECERFHQATHPRWNSSLFIETVHRFGIQLTTKCSRLSRGQRAGVSLALMLAASPEMLILDDPALGLDPVSRRALNETLVDFASDPQHTVVLSSHLLDDVERVADRILVMVDGQLLVNCSLDELRGRVSGWTITFATEPAAPPAIPGLIYARRTSDAWQVVVADADDETTAALRRLGASSIAPMDVPFDEVIVSYLSRSRRGESFLLGAGA